RAPRPKQPFGLKVRIRRTATCSPAGLVSQGIIVLMRRKTRRLWICGQFACGEPGWLAVENARRFPPRTPLPTSSTASLSIMVTNTPKTNIQGGYAIREIFDLTSADLARSTGRMHSFAKAPHPGPLPRAQSVPTRLLGRTCARSSVRTTFDREVECHRGGERGLLLRDEVALHMLMDEQNTVLGSDTGIPMPSHTGLEYVRARRQVFLLAPIKGVAPGTGQIHPVVVPGMSMDRRNKPSR